MREETGTISSVKLRLDRGCFLCLWLFFDFGSGSGQGFGGNILSEGHTDKAKSRGFPVGTAAGLDYILQAMYVFGLEKTEGDLQDIVGQEAVALYDKPRGLILGVRSVKTGRRFLIQEWKDEWYPPLEQLAQAETG